MFLPKKPPPIVTLDKLDIELVVSGVGQVEISPILLPTLTTDYCLHEPAVSDTSLSPCFGMMTYCQNPECDREMPTEVHPRQVGVMHKIRCSSCDHVSLWTPTWQDVICDLSSYCEQTEPCPVLECIDIKMPLPRIVGKSYRQTEREPQQTSLFPPTELDRTCIHGLKKQSCATCQKQHIENQRREKSEQGLDPFDLILPILLPPLGESLDSPLVFPPGKQLYPYQRTGVKFLVERPSALLADEMGLGKSIQAIVAARLMARAGKITKGLILCPKSLLGDWEKKLWEWAPELAVRRIHGSREQRQMSWNSTAHIYLTTYETLREDLFRQDNVQSLGVEKFDIVILDEVQKIKNPGTGITQATRMIDAPIRWGLSSTPLENRVEELITIFAYLKPGLLRYDDADNPGRVRDQIEDYFLRRRKIDVLPDLPEKRVEDVWLNLLPAQRAAYERAKQDGIVQINEMGDTATVQHVLALITKLKQICNLELISKQSCKLERLIQALELVCEQGDKALVFSQYPEATLKFLGPELKQFGAEVFKGSLSASKREEMIERFQEQEDCKVLLVSLKAGGLGLTLTRANYVYHFDLWWNPATAEQAEGRVDRIGQEKTVFVTTLLARDTIEEDIQKLLAEKRLLFDTVVEGLSDTDVTAILTEDELFGLLGLQKPKRPKPGQFDQMSPQDFEQFTADLFQAMGYQVKVTPPSRDQGIDVHAQRVSPSGAEYLAIQCKHYPNGVVGVEHARSLYGVIQDQPNITKGYLVTSGAFSKDCKDFARNKRLELFDGVYLQGLLEKYR